MRTLLVGALGAWALVLAGCSDADTVLPPGGDDDDGSIAEAGADAARGTSDSGGHLDAAVDATSS